MSSHRKLFPLVLLLSLSSVAGAQTYRGSIRGHVVDPSGNVMAGAKVTAKSNATGLTRETVTGADGGYVLAELAAGLEAAESAVPESVEGMWAAIRESLRGSHRDYTVGPIGRAVILLAIPMVLEMVLESLFAVVDVFWVGRLGANAVATVGLTESMMTLIYTVAMGLSIGATARMPATSCSGGTSLSRNPLAPALSAS